MHSILRLSGPATIDSVIRALAAVSGGPAARNLVRISRFGVTLYYLDETYTLDPDGVSVRVHARERFGPIPFLLRNEKRHGAVIGETGASSRYEMPLLGAPWVAEYQVSPDSTEIRGELRCAWAEAHERMRKLS
jgi:hypothetical protein